MKNYHKNPRQITEKQFEQLKKELKELGDLSGIIHDLNSDEIIGGNQRSKVFDINKCEIKIENKLSKPDKQGSIAFGYVIWEGCKYAYRQVKWTPKQCEKANIIANRAGGSFDFDILANEFEVPDLLEWGFEESEFIGTESKEKKEELKPYKKTHFLISIDVNQSYQLLKFIETIKTIDGIEIEQSTN